MRRSTGWFVLVLLIATALAGCIGSGAEDADLEETGEDGPQAPAQGAGGTEPWILQEATAAWLTGTDRCAGTPGPLQLGPESEGVTRDQIGISPETFEHPFTATIESQAAPLSWGTVLLGMDTEMNVFTEVHETDGDVLEGIVPEFTMEAIFFSCGGLEHEVAFTVVARQGAP